MLLEVRRSVRVEVGAAPPRTRRHALEASSLSSTPQPGLLGISTYPSLFTIEGSFSTFLRAPESGALYSRM